jgi:hypothetical protein
MAARSRSIHHGRLAWGALVALAAGAALASCAKKEEAQLAAQRDSMALQQATARKPTPEPTFAVHRDSILRSGPAVMAHVRGLTWDTGAAADRRRLLKGPPTALLVGPDAELVSEAGAAEVTGDWAGKGRVLARITLFGTEPYPQLHLQPGVTYVCVRRVIREHAAPADSLWAFLIGTGTRGDRVTSVDSLRLKVKPGRHDFARFIVGRADENACFPCNSAWCCTDEL